MQKATFEEKQYYLQILTIFKTTRVEVKRLEEPIFAITGNPSRNERGLPSPVHLQPHSFRPKTYNSSKAMLDG